jgi:type IV pilus assembly protein PilC
MEYAYLGYTDEKQIVKGKVSAASEEVAIDMLANYGYQVISLKQVTAFLPDMNRLFKGKIKAQEIVTFSRQLALLIESGVGIIQSLELLKAQTGDKQLKIVLGEVAVDLRAGSSLTEAMEKHPHVFSTIYSKMVGVGEQTGSLDTVLRNLADYAERESRAMSKLKSALMYPVIVLILGIVVAGVLIGFVLPPIVGLFESLGGELPLITRILIGSVNFLQQYGLYIFVILVAAGITGFMYTRSPAGRFHWDTLVLKIPMIGKLIQINELARLCRNMSLLFRAGLPLTEIMNLASQASGNKVVSNSLSEVGQDTMKGQGLSDPMRKRRVFLPMMVELTKVGEETGSLEETLLMIAENYETEAESRTQRLLGMIEPTMTIVMGGMVGFLALSIFIPLYSSLSLIE